MVIHDKRQKIIKKIYITFGSVEENSQPAARGLASHIREYYRVAQASEAGEITYGRQTLSKVQITFSNIEELSKSALK